jgi:F-type H+-transporting ATPase subunit epsilon
MLTLSIVTPERRVIGPVPVSTVTLPGAQGEITILPGHARLLTAMQTGVLVFEMETGEKNAGAVSAGFVEVYNDKITVMAETLELAHEIDLDRAQKAKEQAEDRLKAQESFLQDEGVKWQRKLDRAIARISAAHLLPR